jgi:hypothetical protein
MNYAINSFGKWFKANALITIPLTVGLVLILGFFIWYKGSQAWNDIGNYLFQRQINAERLKVQKELDNAAAQKKALEQTLQELAAAKQNYADIKAQKDELEKVFNDSSKTSAEKVAAFRASVKDDPKFTATDGITAESLCARAREIGASAATVATVCR